MSYPSIPPMLRASVNVGGRPANMAVEDRGFDAILAACNNPAEALDTIMADVFGRTIDCYAN